MAGVPRPEEDAASREEQKRAAEEARQSMLSSLMTPEARERLGRLALVKPEKARAVEDSIIGAARAGRLREKVDERQLVTMLEGSVAEAKPTKIVVKRRKHDDDDDDDDDDV